MDSPARQDHVMRETEEYKETKQKLEDD